ncbi:ABC transporter permease [Nocardia sp. NPDC055049]
MTSRIRKNRPGWLAVWEEQPSWLHTLAGAVILLGLWWLASAANLGQGTVPAPDSVLARLLRDLGDPAYWTGIGVTVAEAAQGFFWGNLLALALTAAVFLAPWLEGLVTQVGVIVACIPLTAVAPLIVLMSATSSRVVAVVLAAMLVFFTTIVSALVGLRAVDTTTLDLVAAYGGGRWMTLRKVRAVAAVPNILNAFKLAVPAAFLGALLGEFFLSGVDTGLGLMLMAAQIRATPEPMWSLALLSAAVAGVGYVIASLVQRTATPWATPAKESVR